MIGKKAMEFTMPGFFEGKIKDFSLKDFKGKWIVLFFYPLDFTFVCPTEIKGFNEKLSEFKGANAVVLGASTDSVYSHKAWSETSLGKIDFPLLGDFTKEVSRSFGILKEDEGIAFRATFLIDPEGIIQAYSVNNLDVGRSVSETLRLLKALQSKGLCAMDWQPGQKHIQEK